MLLYIYVYDAIFRNRKKRFLKIIFYENSIDIRLNVPISLHSGIFIMFGTVMV